MGRSEAVGSPLTSSHLACGHNHLLTMHVRGLGGDGGDL